MQIPEDVLAVIFDTRPLFLFREQLAFALNVSQVCHTWRTVALRTPLLWATFDVDKYTSCQAIETLLERSKHCPIDVKIVERAPSLSETSTDSIDSIFPHLVRCRTLCLKVYDGIIDGHKILRRLKSLGSFPFLEKLRIESWTGFRQDRPPNQMIEELFTIHIIPRLHYLSMTDTSFFASQMPVANLKTLEFTPFDPKPTYNQFIGLMRRMERLEHLSIAQTSGIALWIGENGHLRVLLPSLKSLVLSREEKGPAPVDLMIHLFRKIDAPKLEDLSLHFSPSEGATFASHMQSDSPHSRFPMLDTLRLDRIHESHYAMTHQLMLIFHDIKHLYLYGGAYHVAIHLLGNHFPNLSKELMMPKLCTLTAVNGYSEDEDDLYKCIIWRKDNGIPLKTVRLSSFHHWGGNSRIASLSFWVEVRKVSPEIDAEYEYTRWTT